MTFDRAGALARMGGDVELLREILAIQRADEPRLMARLTDAVAAHDDTTLRRTAHQLRGGLLSIGADEAAGILAEIEHGTADVAADVMRLRASLAALHAATERE